MRDAVSSPQSAGRKEISKSKLLRNFYFPLQLHHYCAFHPFHQRTTAADAEKLEKIHLEKFTFASNSGLILLLLSSNKNFYVFHNQTPFIVTIQNRGKLPLLRSHLLAGNIFLLLLRLTDCTV